MTSIKLCGLSRPCDIEAANRLLPTYIGLVFAPGSRRYVSPARAAEIIRSYGVEHVLFGTDYPMWEPSEELDRFFRLPLTEEEQELILHKNAERLLRL